MEHGVRFVEVYLGGWDTHNDNFVRVPERCATLDQALGALSGPRAPRLARRTPMVVLTTEFGRTPKVNSNARPRPLSQSLHLRPLAGGGVQGGQVYGKTDRGSEVTENKVSVPDFNATIAYALGLPLDTVIYSPSKRPFTVADKGQPLTAIF